MKWLACGPLLLGLLSAGIAQSAPQRLYSFTGGSDGATPFGAMINVGGILYGATSAGGAAGAGTVFSFNPTTKGIAVLYTIPASECCDVGTAPTPALTYADGILYGATVSDGAAFDGTIFEVDPKTGLGKVVYTFQGGSDGASPVGGLISVNGLLYGTTEYGGVRGTPGCDDGIGCGTVFELNPKTGAERILYAFQGGADGGFPFAALTNVGGNLYGTTAHAGSPKCSCGTIFSINTASGALTTLYAFAGGNDGAAPGSPLLDLNGMLYGTTFGGGPIPCYYGTGCGTVFSFNPSSGTETVLYSFQGGTDGWGPEQPLISLNGNLYGVTAYGGTKNCHGKAGCGTIYQLNLTTGAEKVLFAFKAGGTNDSADPTITLRDKTLYGTAALARGAQDGIIFKLSP